ncbi:MAG: transposase [Pseudomonadota bacterium]
MAKTGDLCAYDRRGHFSKVAPMPRARKHLVSLADTPYYHVTSRCVRRAFLCGVDQYTGRSYEHRRGWVEDRVRALSSLFSIDLCAYAVMSNHYHLVVKLNPDEAVSWSDDEVLSRWTTLFRGPLLVQRYRNGESLTAVEYDTLRSITAVYRGRLTSLSWFMKCLNEPIARQANAEDECTGHFWEARFHSQSLCSERALLAAMVYVDLNPVRAGIVDTPEQSEYTSVRARLQGEYRQTTLAGAVSRMLKRGEFRHFEIAVRPLLRFSEEITDIDETDWKTSALPMQELEYLKLVDFTGRLFRHGKRGRIDPALRPILVRLGLSDEQWARASSSFRQYYRNGDLRLKKPA